MGVFLFEIPAILLFVLFADKKRMRRWFPVIMSAIFLRFLDQFVVIDWLHLYHINGGPNKHLWIPLSADATVWPVACCFFLQGMPRNPGVRIPYGLSWVLLMVLYLYALQLLDVFTLDSHWTLWHVFGMVSGHFLILYQLWKWLCQPAAKGGVSS